MFNEKHFSIHVRYQKEAEFLELVQARRSGADYEAKFTEL